MILGAALILVGSGVLYFAVTGNDPRKLVTGVGGKGGPKGKPAPVLRAVTGRRLP